MNCGLSATFKELWDENAIDKVSLGYNIAKKIHNKLISEGFEVKQSEFESWCYSIPELLSVIKNAQLSDISIIFEYLSPTGKKV